MQPPPNPVRPRDDDPDEAPTGRLARIVQIGRRILSVVDQLAEIDAERLLLICTVYAEISNEERALLYEHARIARKRGTAVPLKEEDLDGLDV